MDFEKETPTHKKFGALLDELMGRADLQVGALPFTYLKELFKALAGLVDCPDAKEIIADGIDESVGLLEQLAESRPEVAVDINAATEKLALMMIVAANEIACQTIEKEHKKILNLPQFKQKTSDIEEKARKIAAQYCEKDTGQDLRITALSRIVSNELKRENYTRCGPDAVKAWIDPIKKDYPHLSKGGRSKKE